jgi:hypothetical protein
MINEKNFEPVVSAIENAEHKKFDWRMFLKDPSLIPERLAEQLDVIGELVNSNAEGTGELWDDIKAGHGRSHVLKMVINYFRDTISQEDRAELNNLFVKAGEKGMDIGNARLKID